MMEKWKNPYALFLAGMAVGAFVLLVLFILGGRPAEFDFFGTRVVFPTLTSTTTLTPTPIVVTPQPITQTTVARPGAERTVIVVVTTTPPPIPTPTPLSKIGQELKALLDLESDATKRKDINQAISLYADNAVIFDFSSGNQSNGLSEIRSRYDGIFSQYTFLENVHEILDVRPDPDNQDKATVKVRMRGKIADLRNNTVTDIPPTQELWYFSKIGGKWKIIRFVHSIPD